MKKVFISQPMNGLTLDEIKAVRADLESVITNYFKTSDDPSFEVINNLQEDTEDEANVHTHPRLFWLGNSVLLMADADYVIFANGWWDSKGCNVEHEIALQYEIPVIPTPNEFTD